jgi:SnoaL-like polyketide cyclase
MDIRPALMTGGSLAFGVLALGAVQSGLTLAMTPGRDTPSGGWTPMPDPADGGVISPPFPGNLTAEERANLETFDALDFEVFSRQDWSRLGESHAPYIRAHFPDGHYTDGIDTHIADMAAWFQWAPDLRVDAHPLRLAKDNLTAVTGVLKGTFSKPMPDGKGGTIAPTGKAFAIDMVTVGIWNRQGTMDEEFFFWDNQTFYTKMGLG